MVKLEPYFHHHFDMFVSLAEGGRVIKVRSRGTSGLVQRRGDAGKQKRLWSVLLVNTLETPGCRVHERLPMHADISEIYHQQSRLLPT